MEKFLMYVSFIYTTSLSWPAKEAKIKKQQQEHISHIMHWPKPKRLRVASTKSKAPIHHKCKASPKSVIPLFCPSHTELTRIGVVSGD
ncbi:hypothetical protein AQUCO_04700068v1 [Aquilegia coerulea]|uniref:Uncharacterized protein n=1 Tax=Aquilegia coerulea TaxID=218851 RepID=A0A2G5CKU2_AQUCA|nr:hypothetical protein AQUCO_04700068v1 [Aquilegia coerulea]